jgi:hypothetical protein
MARESRPSEQPLSTCAHIAAPKKGTAVDFGFEAGIGFFLALALGFCVCKIVVVIWKAVAHNIALSRRTLSSRSIAKSYLWSFHQHAWDPLDSYEWVLRDVANLEQYLSTLPPNEEASATATQLVAHAKAVVAICERALRIERIAELLNSIENAEKFQSALASNADYLADLDANFVAAQRTPAAQAARANRIAEDKAAVAAAKEGPLTWWRPDEGYEITRFDPRGLTLSPALIAKAEAELDGYSGFAPGEVENCGRYPENIRLIATAAHRIFRQRRHRPMWLGESRNDWHAPSA